MNDSPGLDPRFQNPEIREGINVSPEHPLREFVWLGGGLLGLIVALVVVFGWLGNILGAWLPFETEMRLATSISRNLPESNDSPARLELQKLADKLTAAQPLPPGMQIRIHLLDSPERNAFATLGGHIFVLRGLIEAMPHENALAMVLAHEIAHVRERHVIRSMSQNVLTSLLMALLNSNAQSDLAGGLANQAGIGTALSFSRSMGNAADAQALANLHALYGHVGGASVLFEKLQAEQPQQLPEWFSSHPDSAQRIRSLAALAQQNGWPQRGSFAPLASALGQAEKP